MQDKVIQKLKDVGAIQKCPRCGNMNFQMTPGYFMHFITDDYQQTKLGGEGIPNISIICERCGWIGQHAIGVLGLLEKGEDK